MEMRKSLPVIGLFWVMALMVACTPSVKVPEPVVPEDTRRVEGPFLELSAIDSLMWRQPDSALAQLQRFAVSPEADSLDEFNGHYCQLLISELLYKNDCGQNNREELLKAVGYFDSIVDGADGRNADARGASLQRNAFLTARAHYINGVGFYEKGDVVNACTEYLKTLEVMEAHFEEWELVEHRARFLAYTYNRLGDMFSEQFMMEPAIVSYENALHYCRIEPTSPQGVSNILTRMGMQYDKLGDKEKMRDCYGHALEALPSSDNLSYRDLAASKALCDYQLGLGLDHSLAALRRILVDADDEEERKPRFLTIGAVFAEEGIYDSAMYYLEPLFENEDDIALKIPAAECLRAIYDSIGDNEKLDRCLRFMALQKKSEAQNKALVSQLDELMKSYTNQKLKNEAEKTREKAVRKAMNIIIPIAIGAILVIIVLAKLRNKKLLKKQQEEADRMLGETEQQHREELEAERQTHRMQQAALSGRLKRSNEELRDISKRLELSLSKNAQYESGASNDYVAFINDPICKHIVGVAHKQQFKSKTDYLIYKDDALSKEQLLELRNAVQKHLPRFVSHIRSQYPRLTDNDMDCCCLVLLGLNEADISAMKQRAYTTVCDRSRKISRIIGTNDSLYHTLRNMLDE